MEQYFNGISIEQLRDTFQISIKSIEGYITRFYNTGTVLSSFEIEKQSGKKIERKKIFDNDDYKDTIMELRDDDPTRSLAKYVQEFYGQHGLYIGKNTIDRLFERERITYKKIARIAIESDEEESALFWYCYGALVGDTNQVMFLDESHRNDKTANPTHGRGKGYVICTNLHSISSDTNTILY